MLHEKKNTLRKYCKTGLDGSRTLGEAPSSLDIEGFLWNIQTDLADLILQLNSRSLQKKKTNKTKRESTVGPVQTGVGAAPLAVEQRSMDKQIRICDGKFEN